MAFSTDQHEKKGARARSQPINKNRCTRLKIEHIAKPAETQGRKAQESTALCHDSPAANLGICTDCLFYVREIHKIETIAKPAETQGRKAQESTAFLS